MALLVLPEPDGSPHDQPEAGGGFRPASLHLHIWTVGRWQTNYSTIGQPQLAALSPMRADDLAVTIPRHRAEQWRLTRSRIATYIFLPAVSAGLPAKIYGVNIGSWLVLEPWMLPKEWSQMGGGQCQDQCTDCIGSEFALVKANPDTADATFQKHWETWFTQEDVNALASNGINTVRIPLGYWLVERLVDRKTEFYPRGGIKQLQRGLGQLKAAGINVILDHHALPGVQTPRTSFAGHCTSDVQFYTPDNYHRALVWTAVMTALSHCDTNFGSVFAIQAANEPIMDASKTPGYDDFRKNFVQTIRVMESLLGVGSGSPVDSGTNFTTAVTAITVNSSQLNPEVKKAIIASGPILMELSPMLGFGMPTGKPSLPLVARDPLIANMMDISWQYNNPTNPADAANGPMGYDFHLYYSFGGGAAPNEDAYMYGICNLGLIQNDAARRNSPLWFGEWSLATNFDADDAFLRRFADAQKLAYSRSRGWIFWNFKMEESTLPWVRQWSYLDGVRRGYFRKDPSQLNDPNVCARYVRRR